MKPSRSAEILGSLVWLGIATLVGCSDAAQEASDNTAPLAQQVTLSTANRPAHVGAVLQGSYQFADPDGDGESGTLRVWLRDGQPIEGANQDNYTATAQDSGKNLQFRVTPATATGKSPGAAAISAGITIENSAPIVTLSPLVGVASTSATGIGSVLSVDFRYSDVDGDAAATAEIRWLRGENSIAIATGPSYTVTRADLDSFLVAEVTPLALKGVMRGAAVRSQLVSIINSVPVAQNIELKANTTSVIISSVLTASYKYFDADNDPEASGSSIQWLRNDVIVPGAIMPTYTLTAPADADASFRFTVTPKASLGFSPGVSVTSNTLIVVNSVPRASNIVVNGGATSTVVGATLSASYTYSDLDLNPEGASVYRWYRDASVISDATTLNYLITAADSGKNLAFEVIPVATQGTLLGVAVRSAAVIRVNNSAPVAKNITLSANNTTPATGSILTASYTYFDADLDPEVAGGSSTRWLRNGAVITSTSRLSYTLVDADAGNTITFEVIPSATTGVLSGNASFSNGISINNSAPTATDVAITPSTARVGTLLTARYTYSDADAEGSSLYEWSNGTTVIGNANTYTVAATDAHKTLTFKVTPVAISGTSPGAAVTSPGLAIDNSPPNVTSVVISSSVVGPVYTGVVLTAGYSFKDPDGDGEGTSTYLWLRDGLPIGGATALAYTVVGLDIGKPLTVQVTPKDNFVPALTGALVISHAITPINRAPVASNVRIIDAVGSTPARRILAALYDYADHEGNLAGTPLYTWKRNGVPVASSATYELGLGDAGSSISVDITPVAQGGTLIGAATAAATALNVPAVSVALNVSAGLKQLKFSWAAVLGAVRYRLLYNADGVSGFPSLSVDSDNLTTTAFDWDISVHRLNWPKAQFMLEVCDAKNTCLQSASIDALNVMVGAIGYFKASNAGASDLFGYSIALSANGNTLAVGAPYEGSNTKGINSIPNESAPNAGAVYVYTHVGTTWSQQAYVKASNAESGDHFGTSVALSADGNTLAVGASFEDSVNTGVTPGAPDETATPNNSTTFQSGAVYVFTRSVTAAWSQQAYVKASNTGGVDLFGYSVALSTNGNTLAVGAIHEDGAKTGVTPGAPGEIATPNSIESTSSGAVYVFARNVSATWSQQAYVKASNTGYGDYFGYSVALSTDGNTLAVGALFEDSVSTGVTPDAPGEAAMPNNSVTSQSGAVYVFTRSVTAAWSQQAYVKASNTGIEDHFGYAVALSGDGNTLAVGADGEDSAAAGPLDDCTAASPVNCAGNSGAVYVYSRNADIWSQQAYVKASNPGLWDSFGRSVALSTDGNTLAIGADGESSANLGVTPGAPDEIAAPNGLTSGNSGAAYVYIRITTTWTQQAYVKASNTGALDHFGAAVALNTDGNTLAVGARDEGSKATGVNNTAPGQSDNSATLAGAVYLY